MKEKYLAIYGNKAFTFRTMHCDDPSAFNFTKEDDAILSAKVITVTLVRHTPLKFKLTSYLGPFPLMMLEVPCGHREQWVLHSARCLYEDEPDVHGYSYIFRGILERFQESCSLPQLRKIVEVREALRV